MIHCPTLAAALFSAALVHPVAGDDATAHFLANEAVLVTAGETRILFDPLYIHLNGIQPIPRRIKRRLMAGEDEFEGVDVVFVSHIHDDHFDAEEMVRYMRRHPAVVLVAPAQARPMMEAERDWEDGMAERIVALPFIVEPMGFVVATPQDPRALVIQAVYVPHAGGSNWASVQNMVYRVTLNGAVTVMHLGDATPDDEIYATHHEHFQAVRTDHAFPPFWLVTEWGGDVLRERINADALTGIHLGPFPPVAVRASEEDFFTEPGETRDLHGHE